MGALRRSSSLIGVGVAGALLWTAASAQAAPLEASPTGSESAATCPVAAPCSLARALALAAAGDVVTARAGDYALGASLAVPAGVQLTGSPGPRPTITGPPGGRALTVGNAGSNPTASSAPSALRHVRIISANVGPAITLGRAALAEDLVVETSGADAAAVDMVAGTSTLRASLVIARGEGGTAAVMAYSTPSFIFSRSVAGTVRNVTAIATSPAGRGILVYAAAIPTPGGLCSVPFASLNLRNVIARGGGADIQLDGAPSGTCKAPALVDVDHSNFRTVTVSQTNIASPATAITNGFNNQTSPALTADAGIFADAAFHQLPTSPTIDAGVADQLPPTDIDGEPVPMRAAPDIGADEIAPATPVAPSLAPVAPVTTGVGTPRASGLFSGLSVPKKVTLASLLGRGLRVTLSLAQPRSSYRLSLTAPAKALTKLKNAAAVKRRTLGRAVAGNQSAGETTVRVKLSRSAKAALTGARVLPKLTLRVRVLVSGGLSQTATRSITVTR